jgi:hypothetical protein
MDQIQVSVWHAQNVPNARSNYRKSFPADHGRRLLRARVASGTTLLAGPYSAALIRRNGIIWPSLGEHTAGTRSSRARELEHNNQMLFPILITSDS